MKEQNKLKKIIVLLDQLLHLGDTCGAANKNNLIQLILLQIGILHDLLHRNNGGAEQILEDKMYKIR